MNSISRRKNKGKETGGERADVTFYIEKKAKEQLATC